ncbi:MAG: nitroreductase [Hyphomonadaceae bacterium]|nr:nitroreductase [Hyphomonadaceae bacterium]
MPIKPDLPKPPEFGAPLAPTHESTETLKLLALRRSTPVLMLGEPGPSAADLDAMLRLAMRVPDHRKLEPWRVLIIEGSARERLGDYFAAARSLREPDATPAQLEEDRKLPLRAPTILAVISSPTHDPKKTPIWEQQLSAGALCQTLMIAANAMGWAACWITETPAYDSHVHAALGLKPGDQIAGFIYLGTAKEQPVERQRPDVSAKATRWTG